MATDTHLAQVVCLSITDSQVTNICGYMYLCTEKLWDASYILYHFATYEQASLWLHLLLFLTVSGLQTKLGLKD